jgi:DNA (cytosine-5)-methyltransferase 1
MTHGSLFSGIGGFDLAAEWMGWENVFHCELEPVLRHLLNYYWPKATSHDNIKHTDFSIYRGRIDILTGGFPCQPYSNSGKRLGKADSRHLWPEMLRAIREIRPTFVVGENVRGLTNWNRGMVFEEVCLDLENEGYEVIPIMVPACAVGAPHRRDRIWFVAKDTNQDGWRGVKRKGVSGIGELGKFGAGDNERIPADDGEVRFDSNAQSKNAVGLSVGKEVAHAVTREFGGDGDAADAYSSSSKRWDRKTTEKRQKQGGRIESFSVNSCWQEFPTQSPICGRNDGLPRRLDSFTVYTKTGQAKQLTLSRWQKESIKAYGNAIVPQVAFEIFKAIQQSITQCQKSNS